MQSDILPPSGRANTKNANRQTMRSLRLRGHSLDSARERLLGSNLINHNLPALEDQAVQAKPRQPVVESSPVDKHRWWHHWTKKQKIISGVLTFVLLIGVGVGIFAALHQKPRPQPQKRPLQVQAAPKPTTVPSPLTGLQVAPELAARPVTGIMVENSIDARPQSGLQDAGVVFEAIAEGGITRFLALFEDAQPQYIGPVRSLRPYYIDFATAFDASIAHVGGSPDALAQIRSGGKDLDQFFNAGSYWRQSTRVAPHNVYTSFEKLDALNKAKGYTASHFTSWPRKDDKKLVVPTAKTIDVNIASFYYNSHYDYDAASNSYLRSEGGRPHVITSAPNDATGQQLHPKVLIIMVMPYSVIDRSGHSAYGTTGSGQAFVFQDGGVTTGTWSKGARGTQFNFVDAQNHPIKLNAGQTWLALIDQPTKLAYHP